MNMNYPKISVITPSYNQAQFLERTIKSIVEQDYPNLEYIVCDGGSTDGSVEIIKKYEDKITWWCSEKDKGQSNAINKGFKQATGDIVCWINSDDVLLEGALMEYARMYNENPDCSVFMAQTMRIDDNDNVLYFHILPKPRPILYRNGILSVAQQSWAWKRDLFETLGYINEERHACMDIEFLMRQLRAKCKISYSKKFIGAIRMYEGTKTSGDNMNDENNIWFKDRKVMKVEYADFRYRNISPMARIMYRLLKIFNGIYIKQYILTTIYKGRKYTEYTK